MIPDGDAENLPEWTVSLTNSFQAVDVEDAVRQMVCYAQENAHAAGYRVECEPRLIARFTPQAWVNDYAVTVDAEGDTEWDCTDAFYELSDEYRKRLLDEIKYGRHGYPDGEALDNDDCLFREPASPEWIREWHGPFDIHVRFAEPVSVFIDADDIDL